jgi:hypothetical protein
MILDMNTVLLAALLSGTLVWLAHAGQRLSLSWAKVGTRVRQLKSQLKQETKVQQRTANEIERATRELADARAEIETVVQATAAKRKELNVLKPPSAREIHLTSEFPPNKQAKLWVARLKRIESARRPGEDDYRHHLMWASDYANALARTEQSFSRQEYQVLAVTRLE